MVVTMIAMGVVQLSIHQVVGVVPMRDSFVTASWAVPVARVVAAHASVLRAFIGVGSAHLEHMLVDVIFVRVMQVPVVKIINMAIVPNSGVTAPGAVHMGMVGMSGMIFGTHGVGSCLAVCP